MKLPSKSGEIYAYGEILDSPPEEIVGEWANVTVLSVDPLEGAGYETLNINRVILNADGSCKTSISEYESVLKVNGVMPDPETSIPENGINSVKWYVPVFEKKVYNGRYFVTKRLDGSFEIAVTTDSGGQVGGPVKSVMYFDPENGMLKYLGKRSFKADGMSDRDVYVRQFFGDDYPETRSVDHPDYTYTLHNGEATVCYYSGKEEYPVIPDSLDGHKVVALGEMAFYQNESIVGITIPETVRIIESECFYKCWNLKEIYIPASVVEMGDGPFFRSASLEKITVDKDNPSFCDIDGVLYSKDKTKLLAYPEGKPGETYTVPEGVVEIYDGAFGYHPDFLKTVYLPEAVKINPDYFAFPGEIEFITVDGAD